MRHNTHVRLNFSLTEPPVSGDEHDYYAMVYATYDCDMATLELIHVEEVRREYPTVGPWLEAPFPKEVLEAIQGQLEDEVVLERTYREVLEDDPNLDD